MGTEDLRTSGYRGPVGTEDQRISGIRGPVGTEDQRKKGTEDMKAPDGTVLEDTKNC